MAVKKRKKGLTSARRAPGGGNGKTLRSGSRRKIRYAVVGLGYIAQTAVLPAFANARQNSELVALISGDAEKLRKLSRKYGVPRAYDYQQYDACLESGEIDAVYIALPNQLHREYAVRAAERGVTCCARSPWRSMRRSAGK